MIHDRPIKSIGLLSDVHANLVALEAVLAAMGPVDALWVTGDSVGYGPDPSDVLALLGERRAAPGARDHHPAGPARPGPAPANPPAAAPAPGPPASPPARGGG